MFSHRGTARKNIYKTRENTLCNLLNSSFKYGESPLHELQMPSCECECERSGGEQSLADGVAGRRWEAPRQRLRFRFSLLILSFSFHFSLTFSFPILLSFFSLIFHPNACLCFYQYLFSLHCNTHWASLDPRCELFLWGRSKRFIANYI